MPRLFLATGLLALGVMLLAGPAAAQGPAPAAPASAFEGYRRFEAQPVSPWRESNDTVGRIGGWKVYAREAQQLNAPAAPAAAPNQAPAPAPAAPPRGHVH